MLKRNYGNGKILFNKLSVCVFVCVRVNAHLSSESVCVSPQVFRSLRKFKFTGDVQSYRKAFKKQGISLESRVEDEEGKKRIP